MMDARGLLKLERRATHEPLGIVKAGDHTDPGELAWRLPSAGSGRVFQRIGHRPYLRPVARVYFMCRGGVCVATGGVYFVMKLD